jgi:spore coat protein CotH
MTKFSIAFAGLLCLTHNSFSQSDGDAVFGSAQVHTINIYFTQANYWDSLVQNYSTDKPMVCSVNIDGTQIDSVGIQLKGNSSYNSYPGVKKSMKLIFDEYRDTQVFDGLKRFNLNNGFKDPTMMREKLMLDFLSKNNISGPRCTYADVYINGTHWGFYTLIEQVNKPFLKQKFGNKGGNLFKGDPQGSLQWYGSTPSSYYTKYELKTNETENDWTDLVNLIDKINNTPANLFYDSLEKVLNTQQYLLAWAASNLFVNLDSYLGSGHNYYIYHNTETNKFEWITWDVNEAFGNFNQGMSISQLEAMSIFYIPVNPPNARPLNSKMLQNQLYKQQYVDVLCNLMSESFTTAYFFPEIDSLYNIIKPYVYADPNKMYTNQQFEDNINANITTTGGPGGGQIPGLKSFISNRYNNVKAELSNNSCFVNISDGKTEDLDIIVYPNPFSETAEIFIKSGENDIVTFSLFDITGKKLDNAIISNENGRYIVNGEYLLSGVYWLGINDTRFLKLVVVN